MSGKAFADKVAKLLASITGHPYKAREETQALMWLVEEDGDKFLQAMKERFNWKTIYDSFGDTARLRKMEKEIGMSTEFMPATCKLMETPDGKIELYSALIMDVKQMALEYDPWTKISDRKFKELDDKNKLEKWRKWPLIYRTLKVCDEAAAQTSQKHNVRITRARDIAHIQFKAEFDIRNLTDQQKLQEIGNHAKAMIEAWKKFEEWRKSPEAKKLVREAREIS